MAKQFLECGKIVSTHGVRGEVRVQPWCDTPDYLCGFETLYLKKGERPLRVESARVNKNMVLLKLEGFDTLEAAVTLRGSIVYIDREDAPPDEEGVYFVQDLIGLSVLDADTGKDWGTLTDVYVTGANDVYAVKGKDGRERLLPAIKEVVLETNPAAGYLKIRPLAGLFEPEDGDHAD